MKTRWIPFLLILLAATFLTGLRYGTQAERRSNDTTHHQADTTGTAPTRHFNTTIAVVNADTGVIIAGARYNYSAAIINTLGENFVLVSPAMAQTGLAGGTYGAIITFPPEVSAKILSFNAHQPQRVQLSFEINPDLPEREFLEIYMTITELQMAINTTLASTYVSSIFRQFHEAQDQVEGVFRNTLADLLALEIITLADFTATLTLDEVPYIPLNPRELDTVFYMEQVGLFATEVSSWYRNSYAMASDQFLWMREGLFSLTDNFPEQENDWLEMLTMWTSYSENYGELLEQYSEYVRLHEEALVAWHEENAAWHEALEDYQRQVADWHEDQNFWFDDAEIWHTEYLEFLDEAVDYYEALRDFRQELEENVTPLQDDITEWMHVLIEYEEWLAARLEEFIEMTEIYNEKAEYTNYFYEDLLEWHTELDAYIDSILEWKEVVNDRLEIMNLWQDELSEVTEDLQTILDRIQDDADSIPPMPQAVIFEIEPENSLAAITIPSAPPVILDLTISDWTPPNINTTPIAIPPAPPTGPTGPAATPNPAPTPLPSPPPLFSPDPGENAAALSDWHRSAVDWHRDLTNWSVSLSGWYSSLSSWSIALSGWRNDELTPWHGQVRDAATAVNTRQTYLQNTAIPQLNSRQQALHDYYLDIAHFHESLNISYQGISFWHTSLQGFNTRISNWDYQLNQYSTNMTTWRTTVEDIIEGITTTILPIIPDHIEWEHVELPEETDLPLPEPVEPLEMLELPDWSEILPTPPPYEGTEILEAFDRDFPLQGNAIEPMYLERPLAFTNYQVPEMVAYHGMLLAQQPLSPLVGPPPRPDDFWSSLNFMHAQLSSFDVGEFLSDDILRMVEQSIQAYDQFLQSIRDDIGFLFTDNIWLMHDVHAEYEHFLRNIRLDAFAANEAEQEELHAAIESFAQAREDTHEDTQLRLASFAAMMPESRAIAGVNQELIEFTVMPFEFTPLALREQNGYSVPFEFMAVTQQQAVADTFRLYQFIAFVALGGVFAGTVISCVVSFLGRKKRDEAEARGFG